MGNKTDLFIEKAFNIHGDKYDYSKVEYIKANEKVCIICPEHGEFWQTPNAHLIGKGCPACSGNHKLSLDDFIKRSNKMHNNKYGYSKVEYVNTKTKVCIICPEHGEFWQTPEKHMNGNGCPKCSHQSYKDDKTSFIRKSVVVHGDKYDYSKVEYVDSHKKVCIICPEHGEFWQTPTNHTKGRGCPLCKSEKLSLCKLENTFSFIDKARKVHGNKYDYSKVNYVKSSQKVCIVCPEHGEFWQTPNSHLGGSGCHCCRESHLEREIRITLDLNNIIFEKNKHFKWLGKQHIDFYLPEYNVGIECQGEQHFTPSNKFNLKRSLEEIIKYDSNKNNLANGNINLIYYADHKKYSTIMNGLPDFYKRSNLFFDKKELIEYIKKGVSV